MISVLLFSLAALGWLTHEPSAERQSRKRIARWKRERLTVDQPNRRRS